MFNAQRRKYLCVLDAKRTAARVDVAAVEGVLGTLRRLGRVKLDHRLDAVLLEDDNAKDLAAGRADLVDHILSKRGRSCYSMLQ